VARRIVAVSILIVLGTALVVIAYGFLVPIRGVAAGCDLFTGTEVISLSPGFTGCVKGFYLPGGLIAQSPDASAYSISLDPGQRRCDFHRGEFIVVHGRAVQDEGRILLSVDRCR
jgi:hypothetical protein